MDALNKNKVDVRNLTKEYGDVKALNNMTFNVHEGEFLSVLGSSGCGKTTLLKALAGLLEPTSGKIFKDGEEITDAHPSKRSMGIVFQNYALFQNMTVLGNVEYALKIKKEFKGKSREIAVDLIQRMGLSAHIDMRPDELSGGQQQRVALARTLALNPEIILFDEPMSALDVDTRLLLRQEIKDIQKEFKTTMIYITHDQEEAFAMGDRIMVMKEGKIEQIGHPSELIKKPASEYIEHFIVDNLKSKIQSIIKYVNL